MALLINVSAGMAMCGIKLNSDALLIVMKFHLRQDLILINYKLAIALMAIFGMLNFIFVMESFVEMGK